MNSHGMRQLATSRQPIDDDSPTARGSATPNVLVVAGYGVRVAVERGHLIVEDGIAGERGRLRVPRVNRDLRRVVVLGQSGTVTLDALEWLSRLGIGFVHLDSDGSVMATNAPGAIDDVRVRRGQALAAFNGLGVSLARSLISLKIEGQERVALQLRSPSAVSWLREAAALLKDAPTVDDIRFIESKAAAAYWDAWQPVDTHFTPTDAKRVPSHWLTFGARRSILSRSPRKAANPANAILNYLYAILEAEARLACHRVGVDPGMGVLHVDSMRRDAFACDLMEAVRPAVDEYVLSLLRSHTFKRSDFFETVDGNCRLMPSTAKPLAATMSRWAKKLAPIAERVAAAFGTSASTQITSTLPPGTPTLPTPFRTPLTQSNRSSAHARRRDLRVRAETLGARCRGCGADLASLKRTFCDRCLNDQRADAATLARATLGTLRAQGRDRRSSDESRSKRRSAATRQMREIAVWNRRSSADQERDTGRYERDIAPLLRDVPIQALTKATGLSVVYCRQLRRRERVPHQCHWEALSKLARSQGGQTPQDWDTKFYLREIAAKLPAFTPADIATATGFSVSHCKRLRRGAQLARRYQWPALYALVASVPR
jgi:CRISPR-associated endonuclease Cas1